MILTSPRGNDPDAGEAVKIRLAEAILSVATEGNMDVQEQKIAPLWNWPSTIARA
jgi:hypothetical protein